MFTGNLNKQLHAKKSHKLFDLLLHGGHSLGLRALEPVGGAAKVAQHIVALVVQEDVLHLSTQQGTRVTACTNWRGAARRGQACHLQVPVDDGRLALVQLGDGVAGVAEDLQHLGLGEARLQPLVH